MSATQPLAELLPSRLRPILEAFAAAVCGRVAGVTSRVEMPSSRLYELVAVITFARTDARATELVAVTIEAEELLQAWSLDVTDRESMPLTGYGSPDDGATAVNLSSVDTAVRDVERWLQSWEDRIVMELRA